MSVSDFEEQFFIYFWRGLVLAGLCTVLWGGLAPATGPQLPGQTQSETNIVSRELRRSAATLDEAR